MNRNPGTCLLRGGTILMVAAAVALLGAPADQNADKSVWVYMPDRPAVLIPGEALRLEFVDRALARWEFTTVVLGQDL